MKKMIGALIVLAIISFAGCTGVGPIVPVAESVDIEYDGLPVYTSSVDLPVTITYSDGSESSDTLTVEALSTGAGSVTEMYTVEDVSDSVTVVFEDWRLVGSWKRACGTDEFTLYDDGTYVSGGSSGNWFTENVDGNTTLTRENNDFNNVKYRFIDENTVEFHFISGWAEYNKN